MTKAFQTLQEIVESGYCNSCGLCAAVVPEGVIDMALSPQDQLRPRPTRALTADEEARIQAVCPGVSQQGPWFDGEDRLHPIWGRVRATYEGWATDPDTRFKASAGGVMTAINRYLLQSGMVDFVLKRLMLLVTSQRCLGMMTH